VLRNRRLLRQREKKDIPSTADAEKKAQNDEQTEKEPEVQVVATQETEGESSNAGTKEPPVKQW